MIIDSKLPDLGTTIFTTVGKMAQKYDAVNLSQGFLDFEASPMLLQLANDAMRSGKNQYAPMQGLFTLREMISKKTASLHGRFYHPGTEITVTAGATQAIFTAVSAFVKKGDEVIVLKPAYDCYEPAIELYGGKVVPIQLSGIDFSLDINTVKAAITDKTRMLIINTPHNPSGTVLTEQNMLDLQEALNDTNIILLSDEVYEHIIFDGQNHQSAARFPGLAERSLICASFGKTFHVTGWKVGYCVGPKELMEEFQKVHQYTVFCVNHPMQRAIAMYLQDEEHYLALSLFYQEKRDYFLKAIDSSRFQFTPSKGTYFQLMDYSNISDRPDTEFVEYLIKEYGLASIPVSVFNCDGIDNRQLRFCFAKKEETLDKAAEIMSRI